MNYQSYFERLIAIDTLISMRGEISSLYALQSNVQQYISEFVSLLAENGFSSEKTDAVQRLLCSFFDKNIEFSIRFQGMSWRGYEITPLFYPSCKDAVTDIKHINILLKKDSAILRDYTLTLLSLASFNIPGISEKELAAVRPVGATKKSDNIKEKNAIITSPKNPEPRRINVQYRMKDIFIPLFVQVFAGIFFLAVIWKFCLYFLTSK